MPRFRFSAAALALLAALASPAAAQDLASLRTRPERTEYRETSRYDEVVAFMEAVDRASPRVHLTTFGYSFEGRPLPLAVMGSVPNSTPEAVRASGKTIVFLQGNIHAGEVEGKEALLELLRELARGGHRAWADSLVLLVAPIYNADGNERVRLDNRPLQHGPVGGMGTRANAQGLNLNRDYTKLDAPESRAAALLVEAYDPHVLVDLHTTNGTFHGYHLTYAAPLHPNTAPGIVRLLRERWLPEVTARVKQSRGWDMYYYGNVPSAESPWAAAQGAERGWYTYDHRPRFSNNYWGLRNRFGILSETYSYLPFRERIETARVFVEEIVGWAHAHAGEIRRATAQADGAMRPGTPLALTARPRRSAQPVEILMGAVDTVTNPSSGAPMLLRRDVRRPERMHDFGTFETVETERMPVAYLVPADQTEVIERLRAHGIAVEAGPPPPRFYVEEFAVDSTRVAARESEGRRERTVWGRWRVARGPVPPTMLLVWMDRRLARLAFTLLEPRSDDGFAAWNFMAPELDARRYPVLRLVESPGYPTPPQ